MLEAMRESDADVVYGVRRSRAGETAFKRATAHGFYRLLSRATEVDIPLDTGDFRLMSRRALDALAGDARAGALHPRHGRLDRLQAGAVRLRPRTSASPARPNIRCAR